MVLFNKYPAYFNRTSSIWVNGLCRVSFTKQLPQNDFNPTGKSMDELLKLKGIIDDASQKYKTTVSEIENTLLTLGTYARIKEQLPEVYNYLPVPENRSLALNIQPIRTKIKQLQKQTN